MIRARFQRRFRGRFEEGSGAGFRKFQQRFQEATERFSNSCCVPSPEPFHEPCPESRWLRSNSILQLVKNSKILSHPEEEIPIQNQDFRDRFTPNHFDLKLKANSSTSKLNSKKRKTKTLTVITAGMKCILQKREKNLTTPIHAILALKLVLACDG